MVIQVQTVLLLLRGRDIPTAVPTLELPFENCRVMYRGFEAKIVDFLAVYLILHVFVSM